MPKEIGSLESYLSNHLSPHRPLLTDFSSYHSLKRIGGVSLYNRPLLVHLLVPFGRETSADWPHPCLQQRRLQYRGLYRRYFQLNSRSFNIL